MNRKVKQKLLERRFDQQLRSAITQLTYEARRRVLFEKEGDEEESLDDMLDDVEGDEEGGDEEGGDDEGGDEGDVEGDDEGGEEGDEETTSKKKGGRGGPQIAKAAYRDKPPPDADDLSSDMFTAKLNAIRSGKSLNDDDTRERVEEYLSSLSVNQRLALYAFLEGLAEVIAAEIEGDDARAPDDPEYRVDIKVRPGDEDIERSVVRPVEKRVAKSTAKEYGGESGRRVMSPRGGGVSTDATDDSPVMVVKRR